MNTGAKEIQQVNPGGPDKQPKHQAPTISSIDKSLSRNHHRVWSRTHRRAIKEESKVANRDWIDYQACSLLQYINVIANLFIKPYQKGVFLFFAIILTKALPIRVFFPILPLF